MASLIVPSGFGTFIAVVLWTLIAIVVFFAWYLPKNKVVKIVLPTTIAVSVLSWFFWGEYQRDKRISAEKAAYMAKYEPAKAIFDKLCAEQSQPTIKRVVEDVEGVLLLKVREKTGSLGTVNDPNWPEAAAPGFGRVQDRSNEGYPESLLLDWTWAKWLDPNQGEQPLFWDRHWSVGGQLIEDRNAKPGEPRMRHAFRGFQYVDILEADGATRTRITAANDKKKTNHPYPGVAFTAAVTTQPAPRYGVTFEDNLDPELRKHWLAGMTIKVIDTKTNEAIGQRTFWSLDTSFGATGQFASWSTNAKRCPLLANPMSLIYSILKPKSGS
jgi:hypothetical protein